MKTYRQPFNIKLGLFILALIISTIIFWINRRMVGQLREDARNQVEHLALAYTEAINSTDEKQLQFVLDVMLPSLNFPIVITTNDEIYATMNLNLNSDPSTQIFKNEVRRIVQRMDASFAPLKIIWNEMEVGDIHYGDPVIVSRIRWLPYLELGFALLFILLALWGVRLIRKSEKNSIYVGMARETAHQLGTPISSLMGWYNLLEESEGNPKEIMLSINEDIQRLSDISDRFSKIGSQTQGEIIDLGRLLKNIMTYIKNRLSSRSNIKLNINCEGDCNIEGDDTLITWAYENIIKNSVDAIGRGEGSVNITLFKDENRKIIVDIIDTGRGIPRQDRKNIFRPGYSTKKRGWGLGLSLTRRIIEDIHNGKVWVLRSQQGETIIRSKFTAK